MRHIVRRDSARTTKRTFVSIALAVIIAATALVLAAAPASASTSKYHGRWSGQVSGCNSNYRIGKTARLVTDTGTDYGWVEWRASRTGHCAGYQWVRFHVSRSLGYVANESDHKYVVMSYKNDQWGRRVISYWKYNQVALKKRMLKAGAYNSRIFYAPNEKACADFQAYYSTNIKHNLTIKGQGYIGHLNYCA